MRLRTFIRLVVLLGVLGWILYTGANAGWSYFATQEIVDRALRESAGRHRTALATGTQTSLDALAGDVHGGIVLASRRDGFPILDRDVVVSATSAGISAVVNWSYPVITFEGREILVVPMTIRRSFVPPP
jgi:hypothetical protein